MIDEKPGSSQPKPKEESDSSKPLSDQPLIESKAHNFSNLPAVLKQIVLHFAIGTPQELIQITLVSKGIMSARVENYLWNLFLQPSPVASSSEVRETKIPKRTFQTDFFSRKLQYQPKPPKYIKIKGEAGIAFCRAALQANPKDITAFSQLA